MDMVAIRAGLAANLSSITGVQIYKQPESSPDPPCFEIDFDTGEPIEYHQLMRNGLVIMHMTVRGLMGFGGDQSASINRDVWLSNNVVKTAIEVDRTLGGAASDLMVESVTPRTYAPVSSPNTIYLGLEWRVQIYTS